MNYELRFSGKIETFKDLNTWREGHRAVLLIYRLTMRFPPSEKFGLTSQLRRAAVSITSNIAEGFSRASYADKSHFYGIALGSTTEVQNQLLIARDLEYIDTFSFEQVDIQLRNIHKLLNALIKKSKQIHNS